ncbi:MAG TPA: electron transfer flavoprotein subunit alpha/FixB family protein [Gemmatimonadaceae bacterium]|nr:electron transfer flavoprotein subunit alpha/FixB family protein [Gemmatimonadaceae bacterium]
MPNILVFAESRKGELRKVAIEAVTAGRALADALGGGEVHALLTGAPGIAGKAAQLGQYGADLVIVCEHAGLAQYAREAIAATVAERAKSGGYRAVLLPFSAQGRDLGPRVAAKLDAPIVSDAIEVTGAGDTITARHPGYANKVIITLAITGPQVVLSLRPAAWTPKENARTARTETVQPAADPAAERVVVKELIEGAKGKLDLGEAPVIVSGGRGLRGPENFKLVEDLAAAFGNAAVGATRAVTDEGWRPHADQIGQTGRQVSPQLYVAVGISGAIQHLAGMRTSRTIVAINKDADAPIFKVADYGIVGDVFEVVPALTSAIREAKKGH